MAIGTHHTELLADEAVERVGCWLIAADGAGSRQTRVAAGRLAAMVTDPSATAFAMRFVDRVIRPEDPAVAAGQLASLVEEAELPAFLSAVDRWLLRRGARLGRRLPRIVVPLARRRMRALVGHLVVDAEPERLAAHLRSKATEGFSLNVNMLGEAVLGDAEARRRHREVLGMLAQPDVDYVSVKVSSVVSQLNPWDFDGSLDRVVDALRPLLRAAASTAPPTFINLDMEEYHDLELTTRAFCTLLEESEFADAEAGIALQAYLPDSYRALKSLVEWHNGLVAAGRRRGSIKIRLVKGANLAMERVEAAMHGWPQAPYETKAETDANYKRCLDWVFTPERTASVRIGVASHNLFDVAWADLLAGRRGVRHRVEFELLEGMAPKQAELLRRSGRGVLLYTPAVAEKDFDVAIAYLFRRLEENASDENFIHHLFGLKPGSAAFDAEETKFRAAVAHRWSADREPRRRQHRHCEPEPAVAAAGFFNGSASSTSPSPPLRRPASSTSPRPPLRRPASSTSPKPILRWRPTGRGLGRSSPAAGVVPPRPSPATLLGSIGWCTPRPQRSPPGPPARPRSAAICCGGWPTSWPAGEAIWWPPWCTRGTRRSRRPIPRCPRPSTSLAGTERAPSA